VAQLGSGVEKKVGAMMSAEEAEEVDHIISLSTLVAVRHCQWSLGGGVVEGWKSIVQVLIWRDA
jgi:hypothetical protein